MKKIIGVTFVFIAWMSCTNQQATDIPADAKELENLTVYSSDVEPPYQIHLKKEQIIKDDNKNFIDQFTDLAIDSTGRIYIADGKQRDIKVYTSDGHFLTSLGRRGKGPGEFTNILNLQTTKHKLYAYDNSRQRVVVFSLDDLDHDYTLNIADNRDNFDELREAHLGRYHAINDSTFQMEFSTSAYPEGKNDWKKVIYTSFYYLLDKNGQIASDTLFEMKSAVRFFIPVGGYTVDRDIGLYGKAMTSVSNANQIYTVWSDLFLIKVYNLDGKYQRAFYYPYERVSLTRESASDAGTPEFILKGMQLMDLPDTWPALERMFFDDENRLWVSTIVEDFEVYEWWVLENTGELLTRFTWPRAEPIEAVKNGKLYTRETEEKTGLQQIVGYDFTMTEQ